MGINAVRRRPGTWTCGALQAAAIIAVAAGCSAPSAQQPNPSSPPARAGVAQTTSGDPCRYITAQEVGKAFARAMKSSKLVNACQYQSGDGGLVYVKVATGSVSIVLDYARKGVAQGAKETEKVAAAGEAYFDQTLPAFIGRVGDHEVQVESTIQPVPREAMIAVGRRIMETLDRK